MHESSTAQRAAIILAAGKGTRMKSDLPKVLHAVAGKPMIDWSIDLAKAAGCAPIIVVCSPGQDALRAHVEARLGVGSVAIQAQQLGTGDAVKAARETMAAFEGTVVVLYGDTPLIRPQNVAMLCEAVEVGAMVGVLGFEAREPGGYGRLVTRGHGELLRIVEAVDASPEEAAIRLCNSGVLAAGRSVMFSLLDEVSPSPKKGEYYLTDLVGLATARGGSCRVVMCDEADVLGVNARGQLAEANAAFQARRRLEVMEEGATLEAPETVFFCHDTRLGRDVIVEPNVVFGPGVEIEDGVRIRAFSHLEGARVASGAIVGPYARLRPGADIGPGVHVGNFVEIKNARLDEGAKVNHLSYVGDGFVGARANLGAGTIFCNYDGFNKHRTHVGAGAFIGSNSALVAPVMVGEGAYVASGSVITESVGDDALAVGRARQVEKPGWAVGFRARMRKEKD